LAEGLEDPKSFAEVFKKARLTKDLSQERLAEIVKCSTVSISAYERGIKFPRHCNTQKFEKALGVELAHILPQERIADFGNKL
jgi:transcriptional regulator with XRE-family HTH domain